MYIENTDWILPSLTLKIVLILIIVGVATRTKAQTLETSTNAEKANPLPIGDPIPDELWNAPLTLWNAADNGTEAITLGDYRGKVIILDFWATWCKSCIANMPRMHRLQGQFEGDIVVLPVTYEDASVVAALYERTTNAGLLALRPSFQSIVADYVLKRLFPNPDRTIPYFSIFGQTGLFAGLTLPQQMNERLITQLLNSEEVYIPPLQPAPKTPLLERSPHYIANRLNKPVYYSMLSGYMEGFTFPTGFAIDPANETRRDYYINLPLLQLYAAALSNGAPLRPNRRIVLIDSAERMESDSRRNPNYFYREYNYCYEAITPSWTTEQDRNARMLAELNMASGFKGEMRKRMLPCLVIRCLDSTAYRFYSPVNEGQYIPMKSIVRRLNLQYGAAIPLVIDESNFDGKLFFDQTLNRGDIASIRRLLEAQGFILDAEMRTLDVFVLSNGEIPDIDSTPLELTKFGYVRKEGGDV